MRRYLRTGLVLVTLAMALLFVRFGAFGQAADSTNPIFGTWKMDQAKSYSRRADEKPTFDTQHTRILAQESDGLRNTLFYSSTASPAYSYSAKFDGKDHADPRTPGKDQTLAHWRLAPDLIVRLQKTNGKPSEWVIYTVSSDGKVFTSVSWVPTNPELQDLQVFTRGE
jgi:hypothetical protein